jgi:hypothetical protein
MIIVDDREIPGSTPVEWREYRYISDAGDNNLFENGLLNKLISQIEPPVPTSGGAITEKCKLWLPSGELLHALSYKGDIDGWRKQIELGAKKLGLFTGKIVGDSIFLSDERCYQLSDCQIEFN